MSLGTRLAASSSLGMLPVIARLYPSATSFKRVSLASDRGIRPSRQFEETPSCSSLDKLPRDSGRGPVKLLASRCSRTRFGSWCPISSGIVPDRRLRSRCTRRSSRSATKCSIDPVNSFRCAHNSSSLWRPDSSLGSGPSRQLTPRNRRRSCTASPIEDGMFPERRFPSRRRLISCGSRKMLGDIGPSSALFPRSRVSSFSRLRTESLSRDPVKPLNCRTRV
mmetsp:Transcript_13462/g.34532  ORF Transcript_13462/g.34532 Transcript_13462/m.34532 type:complete len:222 (+) Transcript_13462:77-742(+)